MNHSKVPSNENITRIMMKENDKDYFYGVKYINNIFTISPEPRIFKYYVNSVKHLPVHHFPLEYKLYRESFGMVENYHDVPRINEQFYIVKHDKFMEYVKTRLPHLKYVNLPRR